MLVECAEVWVEKQLRENLPWLPESSVTSYTAELVGIADEYGVPVECIDDWSRFDAPGKDWTPAGFAGWCAKWIETFRRIHEGQSEVCENCSLPLHRSRRGWWLCSSCGLVRLPVKYTRNK
jgi:hypothetical protein